MTTTKHNARPVAGVCNETPVRPAIVTGSRRCKVCGQEKPEDMFALGHNGRKVYSRSMCYDCYKQHMRQSHNERYQQQSLTKKLAMSKEQLVWGELSELSAFAKLCIELRGAVVVHSKTRRIIPKFILWERIGQAVNHEYRLHIEKCHPDYEYLNEAQVRRMGYKVTEE